MQFRTKEEQNKVLLRLSLVALYILVAYDIVMMGVGYYYIQSVSTAREVDATVRNAIFLVAIGDLIALYFVKRSQLRRIGQMNPSEELKPGILPYNRLLNITVMIAALCSALPTYGLVLVILGEKFETLLLFVALSLLGYQLFRLRPRDFGEPPMT
jgi:hypothetical protein